MLDTAELSLKSASELQHRYMPYRPDGTSVGYAASSKSLVVAANAAALA